MRSTIFMGYRTIAVLCLSAIAFGGCNNAAPVEETQQVNILGKWQTPVDPTKSLETEYGPARMILEFKDTGMLSVSFEVLDGPGGSGVIDAEEKYEFLGNVLTSQALDRGEEISVKLDNKGHLLLKLQNGESYELAKMH